MYLGPLQVRHNILWMIVVMMAIYFATITIWLQLREGSEALILADAAFSTPRSLVTAPRGLFFDRTGKRLVVNRYEYELEINTSGLKPAQVKNLIKIIDEEDYYRGDTNLSLVGLSLAEALTWEQKLSGNYETGISSVVIRDYEYSSEFAHILGYMGRADASDVSKGADANSRLGKYKLELTLEADLKGEVINAGDKVLVSPGNNAVLTIDADWQRALFKLITSEARRVSAHNAAGVIMEADSGDIIASVGYPSFNANLFNGSLESKDLSNIFSNSKDPLLDKAMQLTAAPGSTFKLLSALVLLEKKVIDLQSSMVSTGCMQLGNYKFCEYGDRSLGTLNVSSALSKSSNMFFCKYALQLVKDKGWGVYSSFAHNMGFGVKTESESVQFSPGFMPTTAFKREAYNEGWFPGDTCNTVIGQGTVLVTPLQMARLAAVITNGGKIFEPRIVSHLTDSTGNIVREFETRLLNDLKFKPASVKAILQGMYSAAHDPGGTASFYLSNSPGSPHVKTGTAEAVLTIDKKLTVGTHGWVVGTFKFRGKTYAVSILMYLVKDSGGAATKVLRDFLVCLDDGIKSCT